MMTVDLGARALWTLVPVSLLSGVLLLLVFERFSNSQAIRQSVNRILAHLLEFRLFLDDPVLVLRAQRDLLRQNGRLLRLILVPCLILALPSILLMELLDGFYGRAPLPVGVPTVVTLQAPDGDAVLRTGMGVVVNAPPVHIPEQRQISWRMAAKQAGSSSLQISEHGLSLTKHVDAGPGLRTHLYPLDSVHIEYPPATILGLHWAVWFLLLSAVSGVVFLNRERILQP